MNAKVTVEFIVKNVCNQDDYGKDNKRFKTFDSVVKHLIKNEGIHGIAEDTYRIKSVRLI